MRRLVTSALKAFGARQIQEADTAEATLARIMERQDDVVLLDWEFPDGTGEAIMRAIRRPGHPAAFQTVIMMSGHDEKRRIERALRFGVNGYVAKPVAAATLYAQICHAVLNPRPYVRTKDFFGPQHPLILADLDKGRQLAEPSPPADDKPASAPVAPAAAVAEMDSDAFDLDEIDIL